MGDLHQAVLGQVLDYSERAAMVVDPDVESLMPVHVQPARAAPRGGRR